MPTFDAVRLTAFTESSVRTSTIDTLQYHHAATTSLAALEANMEPGGREVSANAALDTDGTLILKVPLDRRAFTSGVAVYDQRCITVETVNTSGSPDWGISDASHRRLGKLAAEMFQEGLLQGLFYGTGGIIGHRDVPGTYATSCPGPSYDADKVLRYAIEYFNKAERKKNVMPVNIVKKSTLSSSGGVVWGATEYATLGEPVNPIILYKRESIADDIAPTFANAYGGHTAVSDKVWAELIVRYTPGQSAGVAATVALSTADRALLAGLGQAIAAVPAEIDRYADGRKQSS